MRRKKHYSVLSVILALALMFTSIPMDVRAEVTNVAQGKTVTASSFQDGTPATNVIDGDTSSRWGTEQNKAVGEYIEVDLNSYHSVEQIIIRFERSDDNQNILGYHVDLDGKTVYTKTEKAAQVETITLDTAKIASTVRITIDAADGGTINYVNVGISEIEVYGEAFETLDAEENVNHVNEETTTMSASSIEDNADSLNAAKAGDGKMDTQWSSTTVYSTDSTAETVVASEQWLKATFAELTLVKQINVKFNERNVDPMPSNITQFSIKYTDVDGIVQDAKADYVVDSSKTQYTIVLEDPIAAKDIQLCGFAVTTGETKWNSIGVLELEAYSNVIIDAEENVNHVLSANMLASSVEAGSSFIADLAGDDDEDTQWSSATVFSNVSGVTTVEEDKQWLTAEFSQLTLVKHIKVKLKERSMAVSPSNVISFAIKYTDVNGKSQYVTELYENREDGDGYATDISIVLDEAIIAKDIQLCNFDVAVNETTQYNSIGVEELEVYSNENYTLADAVVKLETSADTTVAADASTFVLPEVPGYEITLNGADFEQIIGDDLTVVHPLTDKEVQVSFIVTDTATGEKVITDDIAYIVKGQYTQADDMNTKPVVIPEIQEWYSTSTEKLAPASLTSVTYSDVSLEAIVDEFIADYKEFTGITLTKTQGDAAANAFNFVLEAPDTLLGEEGYTMDISSDRIVVKSGSVTGNMYGMQTILQMYKQDAEGFVIGTMRDYPRFEVRGFMLDMARKPIGMEMITDMARTMRYYKMNDFQLHLSDNYIFLEDYYSINNDEMDSFDAYEAFRLESGLTNDEGESPTAKDYYIKKADMRAFIQGQRALGMNIVPEIDLPAHATSFTKIWPDLMVTGAFAPSYMATNRPLVDHFDLTKEAAVNKIIEIFDDYTTEKDGIPATFDAETVVHIGADEFLYDFEAYRGFINTIIPHVKETNTVRMWGGLTKITGSTEIVTEAIENVQINLWSKDWADGLQMYNMGYQLINTIDNYGYLVPNGSLTRGDAYADLLNVSRIFESFAPNSVRTSSGYVELPSGDDQMLGAAFAMWNDNIDKYASGLTESDLYYRFFDALPFYAEKTWAATGQEKGSSDALLALALEQGTGPNTNPYYQVDKEGNAYEQYNFQNGLEDTSVNDRDLTEGAYAAVENGALQLTGGESYVTSPLDKVGNGNELVFDITLKENPVGVNDGIDGNIENNIIFEVDTEYGTHDIRIMEDGRLGFTRELYNYYFDYELPVGEKVNIRIVAEQQDTTLYVNDVLIGEAVGEFVHNDEVKKSAIEHSTFALPLQRIGSTTNAVVASIDNVAVYSGNTVYEGDKTELNALIEEVNGLTEDDYTAETWAALQTALTTAQTVSADETASQATINAAVEALAGAKDALALKEVTLYYYISTHPVWEYDGNNEGTNTNNNPTQITLSTESTYEYTENNEVKVESVSSEAGVEIKNFAPGEGEWIWASKDVPTLYWKSAKLTSGNWQTMHDETTGLQNGIKDQSLYGTDFTHIRFYNNAWQVKTTAKGDWVTLESTDEIVSYYLQRTNATQEVTTYVKDWAFTTGANANKGRDQKALTFAVVYPDGQIKPTENNMYADSTLLYWDNLQHLGFIRIEETYSYYHVTKITYTMGQRTNHDSFANNHWTWTTSDTIDWKKSEETGWYDETEVWNDQMNTEAVIDGRTLTDVIYPGASQASMNDGTATGYDGSWGKDDAVLILIYLEVQGDLHVKYVDDTKGGEEIFSFDIPPKDEGDQFTDDLTVSQDTDNDGVPDTEVSGLVDTDGNDVVDDFLDGSTITNYTGSEETIEKDLTKIPTVDDEYKNGLYEYQYIEVSEDGKTLIIHYSKMLQFVVDFGLPVEVDLSKFDTTCKNITGGAVTAGETVYGTVEPVAAAEGETGTTKFTYTPTSVLKETQTVEVNYLYDETVDGNTEEKTGTRKIAFTPATTVYYEEGFADFGNANADTTGWTTGSRGHGVQQASVPGEEKDFNNSEIDAYNYGYDSVYDNTYDAIASTVNHIAKSTTEITASSEEGNFVASNVKDGNKDNSSRWASLYPLEDKKEASQTDDNPSITATFEKVTPLQKIDITFLSRGNVPNPSNVKQFSIKYTDAAGEEHDAVKNYPNTKVDEDGYSNTVSIELSKQIYAKSITICEFEVDRNETQVFNNVSIVELEAYSGATIASGGSEAVSTANADTAEFEFRGTGIEIYTNNTTETGNVLVYLSAVKNGETTLKGMYFVDTVMADGDYSGTASQAVSAYNVPIVDIKDLDYGDYHVKLRHIVPTGDSIEPVKFDGFRVLGTLPMDNAAYVADGEENPEFVELRDYALLAELPSGADITDLRHTEEIANGVASQVYAYTENPNHMENATMTASSVEKDMTDSFGAVKAGDGNANTRWSSKYPDKHQASYGYDTEPWLKAEFENFTNIKQINITFHTRDTDVTPSNVSQFSIKYEKAKVDENGEAVCDENGDAVTEEVYAVQNYANAVEGDGYSENVTIVLDQPITAKSIRICEFTAVDTSWNNIGIVEVEAYTQEVADYEQHKAKVVILTQENAVDEAEADSSVEVDKLENGPKNEIYLQKGQTMVFQINAADAQIGLKALNSATGYTILKDGADFATDDTFASSTDMYYDLQPTEDEDTVYTIANTGDGILSVTLLKLFEAQNVSALTTFDLQPALANMGYAVASAPETPEDTTTTPVTEVFGDVVEGAWYVDSIQYVYDKNILVGDGNVFAPDEDATRAMIAQILYRLAGSPEVKDYSEYERFADLPSDAWYKDAVAWALNEEVSTGDTDKMLYNPELSVTREQLALFLWRHAKYIGEDVTVTATEEELFGAVYVNAWAKEGFAWAVDRGIIKGSESIGADGQVQYELLPQNSATRAQLAKMLQRFCEAYDL